MHTPRAESESDGSAREASERRFRLMLLACGLALTLMLAVVYGTVGFRLS